MSTAVSAIRVQVGELTASLSELNDGLQALAQQIGRFGQLSGEVTAPRRQSIAMSGQAQEAPTPPNGAPGLSLGEIAQRDALLGQFNGRVRNRPDIEAELESEG